MSADTIDDLTKKLAGTTVEANAELVYKRKDSTFKLNTAEDAQELVTAIEKFENLKALRLEGNTLGIPAAEVVGKALQKHPEFERALWSDMFTGRLKTEIPQALKYLGAGIMTAGAKLVELDLSDNAFGPNGMHGLVDLLPSSSCYTLNILKLNNNGLGITGGKMLAKCLTECYENSKSAGRPLALKVFISGRNRLENDGTKALAQVFKMIGTLENISMPQNGINPPGILALVDALNNNPNITTLNLNDNTVTEKGAISLVQVIPKLTHLEILNFGDCLLRNGGAKKLAEVLQNNNHKLKELILSGNEIKQDGATEIIEAIENKENLQKLDLDSNQFGEEGCELIKGMLEAMNKEDILETLSDDEGTDDEDEEDQEEDEEEEEEEEEESEGEEVNDPKLQVKGQSIIPQEKEETIESPTISDSKPSTSIPESLKNNSPSVGDKNESLDLTKELENLKLSS